MALPKKGTRLITVDSVVYRWRVRGKPTYCQGLAWTRLTFAAELAEQPGSPLVVTLAQPHPSNWIGQAAVPVVPATVADTIRLALARGWTPTQPGHAFLLDYTATE